ncbi:uncharacterized protein LOC143223077 [Tachypleus tridentatus]|uniref:uncharacterized protein LOC143223077 n=1 Tax=Tachypleus tridentatus TaxID=6853 RepID=UPI003FD1486E
MFQRMRQMDNMMTDFMAPFNSMFNGSMFPQLMGTNFRSDQDVFGSSVFSNMGNLFSNFELMAQNPNAHCYSSSSVMSYSTDEMGKPQIYQASSSTKTGPGGIKETRRSVHDSRSGLQKLSIGHHLGDKAHVLEKSKNRNTGEEEENEELMNLDEDELAAFNREWQQRTKPHNRQLWHAQLSDKDHRQYDQNYHPFATSQQLAITAGPSSFIKEGRMDKTVLTRFPFLNKFASTLSGILLYKGNIQIQNLRLQFSEHIGKQRDFGGVGEYCVD